MKAIKVVLIIPVFYLVYFGTGLIFSFITSFFSSGIEEPLRFIRDALLQSSISTAVAWFCCQYIYPFESLKFLFVQLLILTIVLYGTSFFFLYSVSQYAEYVPVKSTIGVVVSMLSSIVTLYIVWKES